MLRLYETKVIWLTRSTLYLPLVGAIVGGINVGVWWFCCRYWPSNISVGLMMVASLVVTGACHERALAAVCDGLGGGTTPERSLAIMGDSRIGSFGATGVMSVLFLKWGILVSLPAAAIPVSVMGSHVMSRWCSIGLVWRLRYVGSVGEPRKSALAQLSGLGWTLSGIMSIAALAAVVLICEVLSHRSTWRALLVAMFIPVVVTYVAAIYFRQHLGGYTGKCIGALQQVAELSFLLAVLATPTSLQLIR